MSSDTSAVFGRSYAAFLFDMDGTLLSSIASCERVWGRWATRHGLDVQAFLPNMHGKRGVDTIRGLGLPGVDPVAESIIVMNEEIEDVADVVPISGAVEFLKALPSDRWAIVTSSPIKLAEARLAAAGLSVPRFIVTAEDVAHGKPSPECYLLGAERLGVSASDCLVFEDVPAGITAGEAAGADVLVLTATHTHPIETGHPKIAGYDGLSVTVENGRLTLVRKDA